MSACAGRVKDRYAGKHFHDGSVELQIPPLRYAAVGNKGEGDASIQIR
jgi:hypothetical protein